MYTYSYQKNSHDESVGKEDLKKTVLHTPSFVDRRHNAIIQKRLISTINNASAPTIQRYKSIPVDENISQELIDSGKTTTTKYSWKSHFVIYVYSEKGEAPQIRVTIRIITSAKDDVFDKWNKTVSSSWSNKFAIKAGVNTYPITVELLRGDKTYSDYTVENVFSTKAIAGRGLFGTEHMLKWGENDSQDIPHEVGHMLGNKDEYGTVDGRDYEKEHIAADTSTHSIMHKGNEPVRERHFSLILNKVKESGTLGTDIKLVKYIGRTPITQPGAFPPSSSSSMKLTTTNSTSKPGATGPLRIGESTKTPTEAQISKTQNLYQDLHQKRVSQILAFLMEDANLFGLTQEQNNYLKAYSDWATNPDHSAAVKIILGIKP